MKAKTNRLWTTAALVSATVMMSGLAAAFVDDNITLDQVPQAARQELQRLAGDAKIREVETERHGGVTVYEAEWRVNGVEHEACVTADGALMELEETIPANMAPAGVRSTISQRFGADAKVEIEKKMFVMYEVEGRINGKYQELLVSPTGQVHDGAGEDDGDEDDDAEEDDDDDDDDGDDAP